MDRKHTPGPWTLHPKHRDFVVPTAHADRMIGATAIVKDRDQYAKVIHAVAFRHSAEDEANARLIAAAPDLLMELRLLVEAIEGHSAPEGSAADEPYIASRLSFASYAIDKATQP